MKKTVRIVRIVLEGVLHEDAIEDVVTSALAQESALRTFRHNVPLVAWDRVAGVAFLEGEREGRCHACTLEAKDECFTCGKPLYLAPHGKDTSPQPKVILLNCPVAYCSEHDPAKPTRLSPHNCDDHTGDCK